MGKNVNAISLVETKTGCAIAEDTPRFDVMFRGVKFGQLYYNMTGYVGYLPAPHPERKGDTINFDIGEKSISVFRREVNKLYREWANISN
jgi:hypothetical protein